MLDIVQNLDIMPKFILAFYLAMLTIILSCFIWQQLKPGDKVILK